MNDPKKSTIMVSRDVIEKLKDLKVTPQQSLDEVIRVLLNGKLEQMIKLKKEIELLTSSLPADVNPAIVVDKVLMGKSDWLDNWAVN